MSGDVTIQALERLTHMPDSTNPAELIAAQRYNDVEFTGGTISGVDIPSLANPLSIADGGTGQSTANDALNALLPTQTGNAGKALKTDGTNASWSTDTDTGITQLTGDGTAGPGSGSQALTLATVNGNVGSFGTATQVSAITVNAKGLITAASNTSIQITEAQVTNLTTDLAGKQPLDASLTSISGVSWVQGDLPYWSGTDTSARLAKDTNATRYIANTGTSNNPAWAQVDLSNGVTGDLPFANLTQGSARSVLGVTGNATADFASIQGTANQVLVINSGGTALSFGQVNLASSAAVTGILPVANGGVDQTAYTSFSPGFTGFSVNPTVVARYKQIGKTVFVFIESTSGGTSNATGFTITGLPVTSATTSSSVPTRFCSGIGQDSGVLTQVTFDIASNSTTITLYKGVSTTATSWTNSGTKFADLSFCYEAA